ncbi:MAG: PLD nuclease N-terminal domain-containing protein [Microbacteriaceae bacterium]
MTTKKKMRWDEMSSSQQTGVLVTGSIQLALAATAWIDLAKRPSDQVNGPKALWAAIIAINFVGPIAWFIWGRRR